MSDVLSGWVSAPASPSPLGERYCVVDPELAAALQTDHHQVFEAVARDTKVGPEALTRDVPNVGDEALRALDDHGLVEVGTEVGPGDLLVGKVTPRVGVPLSNEEKLLRAIFGETSGEFVDQSLRLPPGVAGTVTKAALRPTEVAGELERAAITVDWTRPLEVGDVLVDGDGHRAVVAAIRPVPGEGLAWRAGGSVRVAKVAMAREMDHARSIGPYSLVTQRPLHGRSQFGGQRVSPAQIAALAMGDAPWTAWELMTLKSDCVSARTHAYESLVKGEHAGPVRPRTEGADRPLGDIPSLFAPPPARRAPDRVVATIPESVLVAERELAALGLEVFSDAPPVRAQWLSSALIRERSHGEVKKPETVNYRTFRPEPDGLFCERIFGPVDDYECGCKKYRRMKYRGVVCEECGVEVIASRVRRERLGHVVLAMPVPHPWRLDEVADALGTTAARVREVLAGQADLGPGGVVGEPTEAWEATGPALQAQLAGTDLLLDVFPVLPPDLRPTVPLGAGRWATSDLNDLYRRMINRNNRLKRLIDLDAPPIILRNEYAQLFAAIASLVDNARTDVPLTGPDERPLASLADLLAFHLGPGLLAKPCDYSAAAALVVDPELEPDVCRLPLDLATELFRPWAYGLIEAWGAASTIKRAKQLLQQQDPIAMHAVRTIVDHWPVLLATDTALTGCRVTLGEGAAIAVAPELAEELASEQVVLHVPLGGPAHDEVRALQGYVLEVDPHAPERSGWLADLSVGEVAADAVQRGVEEGDPVDDPTLQLGLGWWPGGEAPQGRRWLDAVLATAAPPPQREPPSVDDP